MGKLVDSKVKMFVFLVAIGFASSMLFSALPWEHYVNCFENGMVPDLTSKEKRCIQVTTPQAFGDEYVSSSIQSKTSVAPENEQNHTKKFVMIYSNSSDSDCNIACLHPSITNIDAGTRIEFYNTTPDYRHISTGIYKEYENGINWNFDERFNIIIGPNQSSTFMFSDSGEYQLFLTEHRVNPVIGTINVFSEYFNDEDRIINILQKIKDDKNSKIPITLLDVNSKNSVITVGINDKKNPIFTLDVYKTMIFKQVGDVYLNVISVHSPVDNPCDVNDEVQVRKALDDDPVVKQFLKYYPSATFEHFKTYDEPGNPRTFLEFRHEFFLLRILVLTHDADGNCYPVYGYSVSYDDPASDTKKELLPELYSKSDRIHDALRAIKEISNPLKQYDYGIPNASIECKDGFVVLIKQHSQIPSCITEKTSVKLLNRGWIEPACDTLCDNDTIDKPSAKIPVHDIRIDGLKHTYNLFEPINFTITMQSYGVDHGGYEISISGVDEKNGNEKWYEVKDTALLADASSGSFERIYEFPRDDSNPIVFSMNGWYEIDFFVSENDHASWQFYIPYNEKFDFTNNVDEFQDKFVSSMRYDDLVLAFGEPDDDIGSGIHIYVYKMDDGSKVLIGYTDHILYAKHVDYHYNIITNLVEDDE